MREVFQVPNFTAHLTGKIQRRRHCYANCISSWLLFGMSTSPPPLPLCLSVCLRVRERIGILYICNKYRTLLLLLFSVCTVHTRRKKSAHAMPINICSSRTLSCVEYWLDIVLFFCYFSAAHLSHIYFTYLFSLFANALFCVALAG